VVDRCAERDATKPHSELCRIGEHVQIAEGSQERVLNHIIDVGRLNERGRERVHHALVASNELTVRTAPSLTAKTGGGHEVGVGRRRFSAYGHDTWLFLNSTTEPGADQ
jgi:hypothetical protein